MSDHSHLPLGCIMLKRRLRIFLPFVRKLKGMPNAMKLPTIADIQPPKRIYRDLKF